MHQRRVVVTGMGLVSCLGNDQQTVLESLREGRSGIRFVPSFRDAGLRSQIAGVVDLDTETLIDRKLRRFMSRTSMYAYVAMQQAVADAGLSPAQVSNPRTGLVAGTGGASPAGLVEAADTLRSRGIKRVGPYMVTRTMCSTVSACLATPFGIKGLNYSINSACATGAHCIGHAAEQIRAGTQDIVFAGGADEEHWAAAMLFDGMGALSTAYNDRPTMASRPYDHDRDGFVIAGGAGILVLEDLDHALRRGARIYAELAGYGATSDGADMVAPSGEGAARCMRQALAGIDVPVDYINTHGTSTPLGDLVELRAIRETFGDAVPPISSTKSLSGHSLGAAGAHEAIYCLLMMQHGFIAASANIDQLDGAAGDMPIVRERTAATLDTVLSNSFGFGGTNACLVFRCAALP